jgi:hypothetical protein
VTTTLVLAQAAASLVMVGVIWMVQLVNYPLMTYVPPDAFVPYEHQHRRRISAIVGPAMAVELVTAVALTVRRPEGVPGPLLGLGLVLLAVALGTTALVSAPIHGRLTRGRDDRLLARLIDTNWVRTAAWSGRGAVALAVVWLVEPGSG